MIRPELHDPGAAIDPRGIFRPTPASTPDVQGAADYSRVAFVIETGETSTRRRFDVSGDTLYVEELTGRRTVYVRIGEARNPYLRLAEGMEIHRRFSRLEFRAEDVVTSWGDLGKTRVAVLVSHGRLVDWPTKEPAVGPGFLTRTGTATTTPGDLFAAAVAGGVRPTGGRGGGVLLLQNTDSVNRLWFRYGPPTGIGAVDATFYPLEPGATAELALRGRVSGTGETVLVGTTSGSATFAWLLSDGSFDAADWAQAAPVAL